LLFQLDLVKLWLICLLIYLFFKILLPITYQLYRKTGKGIWDDIEEDFAKYLHFDSQPKHHNINYRSGQWAGAWVENFMFGRSLMIMFQKLLPTPHCHLSSITLYFLYLFRVIFMLLMLHLYAILKNKSFDK
jgi:hypothetical protein